MPIRFNIEKENDPNYKLELELDEEIITIGRSTTSNVVLEDQKKIISREHALIKLDNDTYYLIDPGSRNGVNLNKKRIKVNHPYALDTGSELTIGEYLLKISILEPSEIGAEETVFDFNPFSEDAISLFAILEKIKEKYENEDPSQRDIRLLEAMKKSFETVKNSEVKDIILHSLNNKHLRKIDLNKDIRSGQVIDILLDMAVKLINTIVKFRTDFIGTTMIQTKDSLKTDTSEDLKNYLFEINLNSEECSKRMAQFVNEIEKVLVHQLALLDGYRGSIQEGVQEILQELNPDVIKNVISQRQIELGPIKIPTKLIPFILVNQTLKELKIRHYELSAEDRGVLEKKIFRPAFIRRYLDNLSSSSK